jgi:hypothetical protein
MSLDPKRAYELSDPERAHELARYLDSIAAEYARLVGDDIYYPLYMATIDASCALEELEREHRRAAAELAHRATRARQRARRLGLRIINGGRRG